MNLADYITLLQEDCNGASTRGEILRLVNIVQQELLARDIEFMRTTPDVLLETTAGTYVYSLPTGIRSCVGVYMPSNSSTSIPFARAGDNTVLLDWATVRDPGDGSAPAVLFTRDPGTSTITNSITATYACICYNRPGVITDENDTLEVPDPHSTGYMRSRILEMIEQRKFGNSIYWSQKAQQDKGEWLRWCAQQQYDPSNGTIKDYMSGGEPYTNWRWA